MNFLGDLAEEKRRNGPTNDRFTPPYTTFNIGTIAGGTALNIIAQDCSFLWEFRPLPEDRGDDIIKRVETYIASEVLPELRRHAPEATIETTVISKTPAVRPEAEGAAEALARLFTGRNDTKAVSYGTEGGLFQDQGFSTIVCGPGSIDQAHQPNEFIEFSQVAACEDFMDRLAEYISRA